MKKYNLIEELQNIKDENIEKILKIKTKDDLKEEKLKEKNRSYKFKPIYAFAICICIVFIGLFSFNRINSDTRLKINNPLTEVSTASEMKQYLGFDVPVLPTKKVESYIVIGDDGDEYAYHGRIIYKDESEFEIEEGNSDVSGMYGGTKETEKLIDNTNVTIYTLDETRYAIWSNSNYSYSYSTKISDVNFIEDLKSIVYLTNK